jgi:hypothetical protein
VIGLQAAPSVLFPERCAGTAVDERPAASSSARSSNSFLTIGTSARADPDLLPFHFLVGRSDGLGPCQLTMASLLRDLFCLKRFGVSVYVGTLSSSSFVIRFDLYC